jgi:ABC-type transport system involved in multi-copper enzyme maturation permease subunit
LFSRRLVRVLPLLVIVAMLAAGVITFFALRSEGGDFIYADMDDGLIGISTFLVMIGLAFGASFVGAEWQAGTMTTLLTWEPRRIRVLVAKLVSVVLGSAVIIFVLEAIFLLIFLPIGQGANGSMVGVDSEWARATAETMGRIAGGAGLVAAIGLSIATVGRHTAASLGVAFAYFFIVESVVRAFKPHWAPWFLGDNIFVFMLGDPSEIPEAGHSTVEGAMVVGAYALGLFLVATLFFNRRDIT